MDNYGSLSELVGGENPPPPAPEEVAVIEEWNWADLHPDLLSAIFRKLESEEIMIRAQFVCRSWRQLSWEPDTWRCVNMIGIVDMLNGPFNMVEVAKLAIDRSAGKLEEFYCEYWGNDELLQYIGERTGVLKCLGLESCHGISDEALVDLVKRSPYLEKLDITTDERSDEVFAVIGQACPQLKYFRLSPRLFNYFTNEMALEIANNMPGLRHFELVEYEFTKKGLNAILDKCSQLESLDLRWCWCWCYKMKQNENLRKKCARIKDLKLPVS